MVPPLYAPEPPKRSLLRRLLPKLIMGYILYLGFIGCPPSQKLTADSPYGCRAFHSTWNHATDMLMPVYNTHAREHVEKMSSHLGPYVAPAAPVAVKIYDTASPLFKAASASAVSFVHSSIEPHISRFSSRAKQQLDAHTAPHREAWNAFYDKNLADHVNRAHAHASSAADFAVTHGSVLAGHAHGTWTSHIWPHLKHVSRVAATHAAALWSKARIWFKSVVMVHFWHHYHQTVVPKVSQLTSKFGSSLSGSDSDSDSLAALNSVPVPSEATAIDPETDVASLKESVPPAPAKPTDDDIIRSKYIEPAAEPEAEPSEPTATNANVVSEGVVEADLEKIEKRSTAIPSASTDGATPDATLSPHLPKGVVEAGLTKAHRPFDHGPVIPAPEPAAAQPPDLIDDVESDSDSASDPEPEEMPVPDDEFSMDAETITIHETRAVTLTKTLDQTVVEPSEAPAEPSPEVDEPPKIPAKPVDAWQKRVKRTAKGAIKNFQTDLDNEQTRLIEEAKADFMQLLRDIGTYGDQAAADLLGETEKLEKQEGIIERSADLYNEFDERAEGLKSRALLVRERAQTLADDVAAAISRVRAEGLEALDDFFDVVLMEASREASALDLSDEESDDWSTWKEYNRLKKLLKTTRKKFENYEVNLDIVNVALKESQDASVLLGQEYANRLSTLRAKAQFLIQQAALTDAKRQQNELDEAYEEDYEQILHAPLADDEQFPIHEDFDDDDSEMTTVVTETVRQTVTRREVESISV